MQNTRAQALFHRLSRTYTTPEKVQKYLRQFAYNRETQGETLRSAYSAVKILKAHCLEASFVAAAILEHQGYPPLVVSMESQDDLDHVVFVFKSKNKWGAIGRSRDEGLNGRAPVFKSIRSLIQSYVDPYVDNTGRITGYGLAHLDDSQAPWRDSPLNVWKTERYLIDLKHKKLKTSDKKYLETKRLYQANLGPLPSRYWW